MKTESERVAQETIRRRPHLVVMLTKDDFTVPNAAEIFESAHTAKADMWGFKEHPLPHKQMRDLYRRMKDCGKTTFLEVVCYTEREGMEGAMAAADCGCDVLMGTMFSPAINDFCRNHGLKYMPFVGKVTGRPSVLEGEPADIISEANRYISEGAYGIDLLGYRYTGDAVKLNKDFVQLVNAPVCLAGSIDSWQRLDEVKEAAPWAFTIGSAFFEHKFGESFSQQIDAVCDYMER